MLIRLLAAILMASVALCARAEIGTIDNVPAATLLIPHFEVEPDNPGGVKTIITLQNTSASAAVARVTLWTDLGLPTASFNLYLTGYDAETINLRSIFNREVPFTADAGDDPTDTSSPNDGISNKGPLSQDINFPGPGNMSADALSGSISPSLLAAHTGGASDEYFAGACGARNFGDGIARGYVTIDDMNIQTAANHLDPGYVTANDGLGLGSRNILTGDYVILNPTTRQLTADLAVPIEASGFTSDPRVEPPGPKQTFYGRFNGYGAADQREPLPNAWAGVSASGRTDVAYWRDSGVITAPFACGGSPAGLPSGQVATTVFNADGSTAAAPAGNLFPFVSGVASGASLGLTPPLGWLFANLNLPGPTIRQSWLVFRQIPSEAAAGTGPSFSVSGVQLGQAIDADNVVIP